MVAKVTKNLTPAARFAVALKAAGLHTTARIGLDRENAKWGEAPRATLDRQNDAEIALLDAIRAASPGGPDPAEVHAFRHPGGRVFVALPGNSEPFDRHDRGIRRVLIVEPGRVAGA